MSSNYEKKSDKQLDLLREVQFEILDEIVRICNKHNLKYFLIGGTLLGAVRHQGFIPWDDDLDIGMLRKDYDEFIKIAKTELAPKYYLHDISTDKKYWQTFAKIRKNNTLFDEKMIENIDTHKGIFVDIFPFDNIKKPGRWLKIKWSILKNLYSFCLYYRGIYTKEQVNHYYFCKLFSVFGVHNILKFCNFFMKTNSNENTEYIISYSGSYKLEKETYKREWFYPTKKIKFENRLYNCPNNNHEILSQVYDDYMKLPPKNQRVTHLPKQILFDLKEDVNE